MASVSSSIMKSHNCLTSVLFFNLSGFSYCFQAYDIVLFPMSVLWFYSWLAEFLQWFGLVFKKNPFIYFYNTMHIGMRFAAFIFDLYSFLTCKNEIFPAP